jgi:hypothetical protein
MAGDKRKVPGDAGRQTTVMIGSPACVNHRAHDQRTDLVLHAPTEPQPWLLNHDADKIVVVTLAAYGVSNPRVCVDVLMLLLAVAAALLEPGVDLLALAVQVSVDLIAFFLEVAGLAILALFCRIGGLLIEAALNAITPGVQMLLDALTLGCVTIMITAAGTSFRHGIVGKKQQEHC